MNKLRTVLLVLTGMVCITLGVVILSSGYLHGTADCSPDVGKYSYSGYKFDPGEQVEAIDVSDESITLGEAILCYAEWDKRRINAGTQQLLQLTFGSFFMIGGLVCFICACPVRQQA